MWRGGSGRNGATGGCGSDAYKGCFTGLGSYRLAQVTHLPRLHSQPIGVQQGKALPSAEPAGPGT